MDILIGLHFASVDADQAVAYTSCPDIAILVVVDALDGVCRE